MVAYTDIPVDDATRAVEVMEQASRQLMRAGGMLNRDLAGDLTLAAKALRRAMEPAQPATDKKGA